jgi:hypothetical protein
MDPHHEVGLNTMKHRAIGNAGDFAVSADGYKPALLRVDIEKDDCDNTLSQSIQLEMVPEEDTPTPVIQRSVRDAC